MKRAALTCLVLLIGTAGSAMAACPGPDQLYMNAADLAGLKVCGRRGSDQWQEEHRGGPSSGELWDFKKGPSDPIDPSEKVGTWAVDPAKPKVITYTYDGGGVYSFRVFRKGKKFAFCGVNNSEEIAATVVPRVVPCS